MTLGLFLAVLGAALSIVGGGIGTILGTNHVAGSGSGLVAHKPKLFGLVLLLSALPSSQGIYGFLGQSSSSNKPVYWVVKCRPLPPNKG
jgi:V/A-type H+/Na+-transporting ATPase subunit K